MRGGVKAVRFRSWDSLVSGLTPRCYVVVGEGLWTDRRLPYATATKSFGERCVRHAVTDRVLRNASLSLQHRDHPEDGCGPAGVAADVARAGGAARASCTRQVEICLDVLADLLDNPGGQVGEREAVLTLSVLVGAISMARAVDDPDLSQQIRTRTAAAWKARTPNQGYSRSSVLIARWGEPEPSSKERECSWTRRARPPLRRLFSDSWIGGQVPPLRPRT